MIYVYALFRHFIYQKGEFVPVTSETQEIAKPIDRR